MEQPMTTCGCCECIAAILPMCNGFMTVNRDYTGMTPSGTTVSPLNLYFDPTGRPRNAGTGTLLTLVSSISIGAATILIEPETGYVHRS